MIYDYLLDKFLAGCVIHWDSSPLNRDFKLGKVGTHTGEQLVMLALKDIMNSEMFRAQCRTRAEGVPLILNEAQRLKASAHKLVSSPPCNRSLCNKKLIL